MSEPNLKPIPQEEMAAILLRALPQLLSLAHKDQRFRDIIAVGCAKQMPELHKKNGLDLNMVKELKGILDQMQVDREGRRFLYKNCQISANTMRIKLFRAMEYICNYDPEAEKYRELTDLLELQNMKEKDGEGHPIGLELVFVRDPNNPSLVATRIEREKDQIKQAINWRKALADFMDTAKVEEAVHLTELSISDEDVGAVHDLFGGMEDYKILLVTNSEIKIAKVK